MTLGVGGGVLEGELDAVGEGVLVGERSGVTLAVPVALGVCDGVLVPDGETDAEPVTLGLTDADGVVEGDLVGVGVAEGKGIGSGPPHIDTLLGEWATCGGPNTMYVRPGAPISWPGAPMIKSTSPSPFISAAATLEMESFAAEPITHPPEPDMNTGSRDSMPLRRPAHEKSATT